MTDRKSPGWLRGVQIGLGALVIILSIYAMVFPAITFAATVYVLCIVLFFVGIEKIIVGIFLAKGHRWSTIGLGVLVLIFAGLALAYPVATGYIIVIFIGIALLFAGCARIAEGFSGNRSGWSRAFLIGVGILGIIIGIMVMVSPIWGAALAGFIIAIGLLIMGIEMVAAGFTGSRFESPVDRATKYMKPD